MDIPKRNLTRKYFYAQTNAIASVDDVPTLPIFSTELQQFDVIGALFSQL